MSGMIRLIWQTVVTEEHAADVTLEQFLNLCREQDGTVGSHVLADSLAELEDEAGSYVSTERDYYTFKWIKDTGKAKSKRQGERRGGGRTPGPVR